ncbi:MAG: family 78 glycoside hydrolase catalytic domain [Bacteroidota bacterium]|nr:family 78 glycoside hydrolase catalytic domain [Bacteroidota bacterium]
MDSIFSRRTLIFLLLVVSVVSEAQVSIVPVNLRCDSWSNPCGIDISTPALSWTISMDVRSRAIHQKAYQVLVSSSQEKLLANQGDMWNSGKIKSSQMSQLIYAGNSLKSGRQYWWKVKIWDAKGKESHWSEPATWTMGVLSATDWHARWITAAGAEKNAHQYQSAKSDFNLRRDLPEFRAFGPKPTDPNFSSMLLRKEFSSTSGLKRAVVQVSGLGQYELYVNGTKTGDYLLAPGWSYYPKTVLYDTYDVTNQIKTGANAIGLILGNSMYNIQPDSVRYVKFLGTFGPLKAIVQLQLEYGNGDVRVVGSDSTWQVSTGPVTYSNFYAGEDFDARLVPMGWNMPNQKDDARWTRAIECAGPGGELKGLSCASAPVKAIEKLNPIQITQLKPNLWVYDLGQNASVMPEIRVKGTAGASVRIIPAELLNPTGTVDRTSATQDGVRPAWWQYTIATNNKTEHWIPQFFYQGARYLQVELFPAKADSVLPTVEMLKGLVVHSSAEPIGTFSCSNELFNKIYQLVRWAQRSNMMSILTDCPQREKQGWLEQYHLNGPSLRYNFDLSTNFRKAMNDMADCQLSNGLIPDIAPEFFIVTPDITSGFRNSPEWGSSFIIVPWQQYLFNGDVSLLSRYYEQMKRYVAFLDASSKNNIITSGLGDWYDIGPKPAWGSQLTPESFTATSIFFYDNQIMSQIASVLGKKEDAKYYQEHTETIRQAFNKEFFKSEKGIYATGSNTTCAMPLFLKIADPNNRKILVDSLVSDIRRRGNAFTSGEVGYRFLLGALAQEGYSDLIYAMNNQTEKPGYGYQIKKGATSLTEKWDASVGSFGSQNHFMSGQINEWFFHDLLGIGVEADGAGFRRSIIKPMPVGDLRWVKGSYQTISGLISVEWKHDNGTFELRLSIPGNTSATVYVPAKEANNVFESDKCAAKSNGIKFLRMEKDRAVYEVGSGNYHFVSIEK